ncbi:MAG TPA: hypothetical protein VJ301_14505 [Propionibacteriaceae bacterium]|nr:hypothetical protein [Propionibacteriaceae bacterium]
MPLNLSDLWLALLARLDQALGVTGLVILLLVSVALGVLEAYLIARWEK